MIHVVTHDLHGVYADQIATMHRMRRETFIVSRGWDLEDRDGGEYDRGDDDKAIYFMMLDAAGGLQVSIRLRPVLDWSILIDEIPECIEGDAEALRRPDVWEMARHLASGPGRAVGEAKWRAAEFRVALLEATRSRGVAAIVGSVDVGLLAHGIRSWFDFKPLGLPVAHPEGGAAVGYEIPVTDDLIHRLRQANGLRTPAAYELPAHPPPAITPAQLERAHRTANTMSDASA